MNNSDAFRNIEIGRALKKHLAASIRAHVEWATYRDANGLDSRTAPGTRDEIFAAADALGIDLIAVRAAFMAAPATTLPLDAAAIAAAVAALVPSTSAQPVDSAALDAPLPAPILDQSRNVPQEEPSPMPTQPDDASQPSQEGFEGRDAATVMAELIGLARPHLTPYAADTTLPGLLLPLIEAAVRGPRVVTQVKHVNGPAPVMPDANVTRWVKPNAAFGLTIPQCGKAHRRILADGPTIALCDYANAPAIDPDYVWQPAILAALVACDVKGRNVWCFGEAGTGKTEGAQQYAARLRRPFVRIALNDATELADIIGQEVLAKDGGMAWRDGMLTAAFRQPYCVILIDEPTFLRPGVMAAFQTALDGARSLWLPTGERVEAAQGVLILAADNTAGSGDASGRYVETRTMNAAFMNRFALKVQFSHLAPAVEAAMVSRRTGLALDACRIMSDFAGLTRKDCSAGKLTMGITPRELIYWADMVTVGMLSADAFASVVLAAADPTDKTALEMLASTSLTSEHARIDSLAHGQPQAAAPAPAFLQEGTSAIAGAYPKDQG